MLGNLLAGFIAILVASIVTPTIGNEVKSAQLSGGNGTGDNVTGATDTILGLTILFWTLAVAATGIAVATKALKEAGII